jgi:hypothetical protein
MPLILPTWRLNSPIDATFNSFYKNRFLNRVRTTFRAVLRIRDVYPGSDFFFVPDPRIRIKEFKFFIPKKWFLWSRKYDPGCSSRIRILTFHPSRIQRSKRHRIPDPQHCIQVCKTSTYYDLLQKFTKYQHVVLKSAKLMLISSLEFQKKVLTLIKYKSHNKTPQFLHFSLYFLGLFHTGVVLFTVDWTVIRGGWTAMRRGYTISWRCSDSDPYSLNPVQGQGFLVNLNLDLGFWWSEKGKVKIVP